ncbi:MAG: hypothetical protein IIA09_10265 [Proteobacteria bacterium]|nr:hypothetical protein [Pseudomonadota bacterium]
MRRIITLIAFATLLSGCAHKDLKAPCANVAAFNTSSVPCNQPMPVNRVPSTFAR